MATSIGLTAAWVCEVRAQAATPAPGGNCRFEAAGTATVRAINDGRDIVLDDGRIVRLDAIEVPHPPTTTAEEADPRWRASNAARAALEAMLVGRSIELRRRGPLTVDRYGRTVAFVHVAGDHPSRSVAHEMLDRGHARVAPQVGNLACSAELLARERIAREATLGLWGEPYYAIRRAESGADLLAGRGLLAVVEGKILSVRETGGTIYI